MSYMEMKERLAEIDKTKGESSNLLSSCDICANRSSYLQMGIRKDMGGKCGMFNLIELPGRAIFEERCEKMTPGQYSDIQRCLGRIEGLAYGLPDPEQMALNNAISPLVSIIDEVYGKKEEGE